MSLRILILGATGVSGLTFIPIALTLPNPPAIMLYVWSRTKLPAGIEKQARIVEASLTDQDALLRAMEGADIVISVLGADRSLQAFVLRTKTTVFTVPLAFSFWLVQLLAPPIGDTFPGILSAMRMKGIKRIFALSTPSTSPNPSEVYSYSWSAYVLLAKVVVPQGDAEMMAIAEGGRSRLDRLPCSPSRWEGGGFASDRGADWPRPQGQFRPEQSEYGGVDSEGDRKKTMGEESRMLGNY